jgi:flagellar biosynthetic protein FliQ
MTGAAILDIARDGIGTFLKVSAPLMLVALAVGLVISLIQALTQIQEQTLVYVPKIVAVFGALLLALPFMADALASYMGRIALRIASGG